MERLPRPGEELAVKEIQRVSGGTAANVAVASSRILGRGRVAFLGALGDDEIADRQRGILREEGVDDSGVLCVHNEESGQAYITIDDRGENEIHTYFGANNSLTGECLTDSCRLRLVKEADVSVIMDPPLETAWRLAELSKEYGCTVIWDPGVYAENGFDSLKPVMRNIDYFILNHLEFEKLVGSSKPQEISKILSEHFKDIKAIVKLGSEGSTLMDCASGTTIHVDAIPLNNLGLDAVNTVGCGDAFIGAFAAAKVEGKGELDALRFGNVAGSFKATRKETRGSPTRSQLIELMERWEKL